MRLSTVLAPLYTAIGGEVKNLLLILVAASVCTFGVFADDFLDTIDDLHDAEKFEQCYTLLQEEVKGSSGQYRAEIMWRFARATVEIGDDLDNAGAPESDILAKYEEGEKYADEAIAADPNNHLGYFWKSANMGRWGQVKGILNSLFKAKPMRDLLTEALEIYPGHGDSYNVLGMLYEQVPGKPVSFGNADYAVSIGRKAVDANKTELDEGKIDEVKYAYYMELAHHLWERDWSREKREREQRKKKGKYEKADSAVEKAFLYEGMVTIPNVSDREEAIDVMEWFVSQLEALPSLDSGEIEDLEEGKSDLASWR